MAGPEDKNYDKTPRQRKPRATGRFVRFSDRWGPRILIFLFIFSGLAILYWERIFIFVKPGENGVLYRRFLGGTDLNYRYLEGLNTIFPWDTMYIYDIRVQQVSEKFTVLAKDGLNLDVEVSIRYRPREGTLPLLHVKLGPDYAQKIVIPEIKGKLRYLMGQYTPDEIYRSQGLLVRRVVEAAAPELEEKLITLDDLLLTKIELPQRLASAIENKLEQEQSYLEYEFRIRREEQEAIRKRIEAEGIQNFQTIIEDGEGSNFRDYLTYLGIQATLALSTSENAKVVVVGGEKGLPLILNLPDSKGIKTDKPAEKIAPAGGTTNLPPTTAQSPAIKTPSLDDLTKQALISFRQMPGLQDILAEPPPQ